MSSASAVWRRDPGSFRDPTSHVVREGAEVLRVVERRGWDAVDRLLRSDLARRREADGSLLATDRAEDVDLGPERQVYRHPVVEPWSYPAEWSFSMLREAALLHLSLQEEAAAEGLALKDASAFNITFRGTAPVFVDIGSFELQRPGEPWRGYHQFCRHFLYPLLVQAHAGVCFQQLLRGSLEGISPDLARALLGGRSVLRRGVAVHVVLHALTQGRFREQADHLGAVAAAEMPAEVVARTVARMRRTIEGLTWGDGASSTWSGYTDRSHYGGGSLGEKDRFVERALARRRRQLVLDLGCNDGRYSLLAARHAESVVAVDSDHLTVDRFFHQVRSGPHHGTILPLVMDLTDPTPSSGWALAERSAFAQRVAPDLILALAVVHHLVLSGNVPLEAVVADLAAPSCPVVIEIPTESDPMVVRLLRARRPGDHHPYGQAAFERAAAPSFRIVDQLELAGGTRVLYELQPHQT